MLSLNKVRKIEIKRTRIKGNREKDIAPFHAVTLTVSHSPSHHANPFLEKIQISLMSEKELPILETQEAPEPRTIDMYGRVVYYIKDDPDHLFISIPNGNGYFNGASLFGGVHTKDGRRLRTERIDYFFLRPVSVPEVVETVLAGYDELEKEFNENEAAGMRASVDDPTAFEGGFADNE